MLLIIKFIWEQLFKHIFFILSQFSAPEYNLHYSKDFVHLFFNRIGLRESAFLLMRGPLRKITASLSHNITQDGDGFC